MSLLIHHGALAPHARPRSQVIRFGRPAAGPTATQGDASPHRPQRAWTWPAPMRRLFALEVLAGCGGGGRLRVIALVQDPAVGRPLLTHGRRTRSAEAPGPAPPTRVALGSTPRSVPAPRAIPLTGARHRTPPPSLDPAAPPTQDGSDQRAMGRPTPPIGTPTPPGVPARVPGQASRRRLGQTPDRPGRLGPSPGGLDQSYAPAQEVRRHGITVNAVPPRTMDTAANREPMPGADRSRWVRPESVADAVLSLARDAAAEVTVAPLAV